MIQADGLTMRYGSNLALSGATFETRRGEIVGMLGPNGAGKSTTFRILTTCLAPTAGAARVGGHSVADHPLAVRRITGYMPETPPLYPEMEVGEYLLFVARARGIPVARRASRLDWVAERCALRPEWRTPARWLSKGYRQRVSLAQAIVHEPAALILDEPTSGLDPFQIREIRTLVRELAQERAVILSTHILSEAETMADRIIIINRGRLVGQGTLEELRRLAGGGERVAFAVKARRPEAEKALKSLPEVTGCAFADESGGIARFHLSGGSADAMLTAAGGLAHRRQWPLAELSVHPLTLEETFIRLAGRAGTDAAGTRAAKEAPHVA